MAVSRGGRGGAFLRHPLNWRETAVVSPDGRSSPAPPSTSSSNVCSREETHAASGRRVQHPLTPPQRAKPVRRGQPGRTARTETMEPRALRAKRGHPAMEAKKVGEVLRETHVMVRHIGGKLIGPKSMEFLEASCNPGEVATGGGGATRGATGVYLEQSLPIAVGGEEAPSRWVVTYENTTAASHGITAWVVCASP
jgi:hypothetical protein